MKSIPSFRVALGSVLLLTLVGGSWLGVRLHRERRLVAHHRADSLYAQGPILELDRLLDQPEVVVCQWSLNDLGDASRTECILNRKDQRDAVDRRQAQALYVLEGMGTRDSFAAPFLETRVRSATTAWVRELAVELLGRAGRNLPDIESRLSALASLDTSSTWRNSLSSAHVQARTSHAARQVATWIDSMVARRDNAPWPFVDLGQLGPRARDLRTRVDLLLHPPRHTATASTRRTWRRSTLRALGWTRDPYWLPALLDGLRDTSDWPSACAAAISLGNLGDTTALSTLRTFAATHWHKAVRESAQVAIRRLERQLPPLSPDTRASYLGAWYQDGNEGVAPPNTIPPQSDSPSACPRLPPESLATLRYQRHIHTLGDHMEIKTTVVQATPRISCGLADGLVLGNDEGEWGGEIAWRTPEGRITIIDSTAIREFHRIGDRLVAVSDHRHMGMNGGELLEIIPVAGSVPVVTPLLTLPGAVIRSWKTPDGGLYLECSHGHLVLDPRGRPQAWPPLPR